MTLKKTGQGLLHYLVAYRYRLQGNQPGKLNGLRVTRTIRPANEDKVLYKTGLYAPDPLTVPVGQVYDIGLEIITDHPVDHVVVTDPLPAGFEAVDNSFQTTTPYFQAQGDSWQLGYQTIYHDRVVAFGDKLDPGGLHAALSRPLCDTRHGSSTPVPKPIWNMLQRSLGDRPPQVWLYRRSRKGAIATFA